MSEIFSTILRKAINGIPAGKNGGNFAVNKHKAGNLMKFQQVYLNINHTDQKRQPISVLLR